MNEAATKAKPDFTTKAAKSTKFNHKTSQTFVAFVRFVVSEYFVISKCVVNGSTLYDRRTL